MRYVVILVTSLSVLGGWSLTQTSLEGSQSSAARGAKQEPRNAYGPSSWAGPEAFSLAGGNGLGPDGATRARVGRELSQGASRTGLDRGEKGTLSTGVGANTQIQVAIGSEIEPDGRC